MNTEVIEAPAAQPAQPLVAQPAAMPMTALDAAIRAGASADQLERMLELEIRANNHQLELMREKRRMDEEDRKAAALLAFRRDFAAFRGENIVITKDKLVDRGRAGSFMQAEYHAVMQKLSPALSRHGFGIRHDQRFGPKPWPLPDNPNNVVGWVWVTCFLEHKDGHVETLELEGPEGDQSANTPVQNMQLTASYLKRQSTLAITGTATGGEDDENGMSGKLKDRSDEAEKFEAMLTAFREAAMQGSAALRKHYDKNPPGDDFWRLHNKALKAAAKMADEGGAQ